MARAPSRSPPLSLFNISTGSRLASFLRLHGGALALLSALIYAMFLPVYPPAGMATEIRGADEYSAIYTVNWAQHVLWRRPWAYYQMPIFHPQDFPRFFTDVNPLMSLVTAPLRIFQSPILSYNVMMVVILILVGWSFYLVGWKMTKNRRAALVGAMVYACNGDQLFHAFGHPNIACPLFFPPAIYLLFRLREEGRTLHAAGLAGVIILQFFATIYLGVTLLILCGLIFATFFCVNKFRVNRGIILTAVALAVAALTAFVYTAPFRNLSARYGQTRNLNEAARYSADLSGYALPFHGEWNSRPLLGELIRAGTGLPQRLENAQFLGYLPWFLAIAFLVSGVLAARRGGCCGNQKRMLLLIPATLAGFILSLGPWLWVGGKMTAFPMPFKWMWEFLPPLQFIRTPARFAIFVDIFISFGVLFLLAESGKFNPANLKAKAGIFLAIVLVLFIEYFPCRTPARIRPNPAAMAAITRHDELKTVMALPVDHPQFLVDSAVRFPRSPSGTNDGVFNFHYQQVRRLFAAGLTRETHGLLRALQVDGVAVYDGRNNFEEMAPYFSRLEKWDGGALLKVNDVIESRENTEKWKAIVSKIGERPDFSESLDFPENAVLWTPGNWRVLDDGDPPQWKGISYQSMRAPGFVCRDLREQFFDGIDARPLSEIAKIHVKMAVFDEDVTYGIARVQWLTEGDDGWSPEKAVESFVRTDGRTRIVSFDLKGNPNWRGDDVVTGLQFEFLTTPFPGLRITVDEIRLEPAR